MIQEKLTKDLEELKNKQTEVSNTLDRIKHRITEAEELINNLEERIVEIIAPEQNIGKRMENEDSLRDLWDNIKCTNTHVIGVPEGKERARKDLRKHEDIIAEKFSHVGKEIINQVQEKQRVPGRMNPRRNTPRHTVIKLTKKI